MKRNQILFCALGFSLVSTFALTLAMSHAAEVSSNKPNAGQHAQSFEQLAARAQTAMEANHLDEAIRLYGRATELRPTWSEGWWHLGTLLFDSGNFPDARTAFAHFVSVEKREPGPGFAMLGLCEFQLKQYPKALADLEHGREVGVGSNAEFVHSVLYHDGILNTLSGQPEIALQRLTLLTNQIAAAHPAGPEDAVIADGELLDALGLAALRISKLPPDVPTAQGPLIREAGRVQAFIALQNRVAAEAEFKRLLERYSSEPGVHYMHGVFLLKDNPPFAVGEFRNEIQVSPSHFAARIQLALEFLRTADYEQGLKYAKEAVALAPGNFVAHVACGRVWLALRNTSNSLQELRTAVKLAPGSPDAHFALSRALSEAGQNSAAAHERAEFERLKALSDAADRKQ